MMQNDLKTVWNNRYHNRNYGKHHEMGQKLPRNKNDLKTNDRKHSQNC